MKNKLFLLIISLLLLVALAACGSKKDKTVDTISETEKAPEVEAPETEEDDAEETEADTETETASEGDVMKRINDTGVFRVGFEGTYPPFNYQDEKGDYVGFDVDISKEIAKRLAVDIEFVTSKWAGLIGGLNADKFDTIIAQMTVTDERKESVDFTDPYVVTGAVIVTHNDSDDIKTLEELDGKKVGAAAGTSFADLAATAEGADVKLYEGGFSTYVNDVINKRLDALINDSLVMGYNIEESGHPIKITSELLSKDANAMAIKKGNEDFVDKLNEALAGMKEDGTYNEIYMNWFGMEPLE